MSADNDSKHHCDQNCLYQNTICAFAVSFPLAPCYNGTDRHIHRKENRQTNEFRLPGQTDGRNGRGSQ